MKELWNMKLIGTCADVTEGHKFWITIARIDEVLKDTSNKMWWMSTQPTDTSGAQHLYSLIPEAKELQKLHKFKKTKISIKHYNDIHTS